MSTSSSPGASGAGITPTSYQPNLGFTSDVLLNPEDDKAMIIQFNAVLPLKAWKWEDGKSNVYLRFEHPMLGGWKYDIGPGELRDAGNGLYAVRFDLKLDYEFVKSVYHGILYKYLVYSPRFEEKEKHPWEYLYGDSYIYESVGSNRILKIPKGKVAQRVRHRQYDSMIFPEEKKPKIVNIITASGQDDSSRLVIPSPPIMRALCMEIHLQPSRDILLDGSYKYEIYMGINGIIGLLDSVRMQYIECHGLEHIWTIDISTAFMDWSMSVADELLTSDTPLEPHKTLLSGLLLMCSVYKSLGLPQFKNNIPDILTITLLKLMVLFTDTAKNDLDYVKSLMNDPYSKQYVINGLKYLINSVIKMENLEHVIDIFRALPLYHFMTDDRLKPHQPFRYHCEEAIWGDDQLHLNVTKSLIERQDYQLIDEHHDTLQRLVSFDPKLLYIIPYICSQKDICLLCDIVPLDIAIAWIPESLLLQVKNARLTHFSMKDLFIKPMAYIQQNIIERDSTDFQVILYCYVAAVYLVECLQKHLYADVTKNTMTFVTSTVKLMLCIIDKAKTIKKESDNDLIRNGMSKVKDLLKRWVAHNEVVGGSFFGGSVRYKGHVPVELRKEKKELQIWEELLILHCPTRGMQEDLELIVTSLVDERVSAIPSPELKIDLFINFGSRDEYPDAIRNLFLIKATEALDELVSIQHILYMYNHRWGPIGMKSNCIIGLFSKIFEKKYPNFRYTNEVPFNDLLEWEMWPGFITIYTTQSEIQSKSENWQLIVACAVSMLEGVCRRIYSGDITVDELKHIKCHQTQMNKLCNAINSTTQSEPQASLTQTSELHKSIGLRLKEFEYFTEYVNKLKHLITQVGNFLTGYYDLLNQLQVNFWEKKINCLCRTLPDGSHRVICFPFADEHLECCLNDFYIMSVHHFSDIFNVFWQDQIKKVSASQSSISVEQVDALLWRPVFDRCNKLLDDLKSKELKLSEVDDFFKHRYEDGRNSLLKSLQCLHSGTNACKMTNDDSLWIENIVENIGQYWDLCNYHKTATPNEKKIFKKEKASLEKKDAALEGERKKLEQEKKALEKDTKGGKIIILNILRDIQEKNQDLEKENKVLHDIQQELQGKNQRLQEENQILQNERKMENQIFQEEQQKLHNEVQQLRDERQRDNQMFQEEQQKLCNEIQQLQDERRVLQKQILANEQSWKINHKDVKMTKEELGRGGWGVIWVGEFRGQKVAVKQMHESIVSEYNLQLLHREINTMSQLHHPNLVQFIGAVLDDPSGQPLIITEIMDMSLRDAYEKKQLIPAPVDICLSIMRDVAVGLNYLHCLPDPIIHRDVSSANVLLESKSHGRWKTKISDFGSAKFARTAVTKAKGAIIYSAPESLQSILDNEEDQPLTPKMDVFSYGVLLCEVLTCQFPNDHGVFKAMLALVRSQHHPYLHDLIQSCIKRNPQDRPNMDQVIQQFDTHT